MREADFTNYPEVSVIVPNFVPLCRIFEIVVFTAGLKPFASAVLDRLDPDGEVFNYRLFRDSCYVKDGKFVKNLDVLGRELTRTVIIDDSPEAFAFQRDNGIVIKRWFGDPHDDQLPKLARLLQDLVRREASVPDFIKTGVRQCNSKGCHEPTP